MEKLLLYTGKDIQDLTITNVIQQPSIILSVFLLKDLR